MFSRYWLHAIMIGLAACLSFGALAQEALDSHERPKQQEEPQQSRQSQAANDPPINSNGEVSAGATYPNASQDHNQAPPNATNNNSQDGFASLVSLLRGYISREDTLAQWLMVFFGAMATGISVFAVVLLKRTLEATRETLREAENATKAAEVAAGEARRHADIAESSMYRLERPYLFIEVGHSGALFRPGAETVPFIEYNIINHGKLPGILRAVSVALVPFSQITFEKSGPVIQPWNNAAYYDVIAPGKCLSKEVKFRAEVYGADTGESWERKTETLALVGTIQYDNPTGALHIDKFLLLSNTGYTSFRMEWSEQETYRDEDRADASKKFPHW